MDMMDEGKALSVKEATAGSRANKVLKVVAVVLVAIGCLAIAFGAAILFAVNVLRPCWQQADLSGADARPAQRVPALSEWAYFDEFWEEADPLSASYAEMAADGSVARYRLKDGWGPNRRRTFRHLPVVTCVYAGEKELRGRR